jgi:hypothetical protein
MSSPLRGCVLQAPPLSLAAHKLGRAAAGAGGAVSSRAIAAATTCIVHDFVESNKKKTNYFNHADEPWSFRDKLLSMIVQGRGVSKEAGRIKRLRWQEAVGIQRIRFSCT